MAADDERWATARSLLHDEDIDLADRVAGLLVLLYGQQLSRITALTRDRVELTSGGAGCTSAPACSRCPRRWRSCSPVS